MLGFWAIGECALGEPGQAITPLKSVSKVQTQATPSPLFSANINALATISDKGGLALVLSVPLSATTFSQVICKPLPSFTLRMAARTFSAVQATLSALSLPIPLLANTQFQAKSAGKPLSKVNASANSQIAAKSRLFGACNVAIQTLSEAFSMARAVPSLRNPFGAFTFGKTTARNQPANTSPLQASTQSQARQRLGMQVATSLTAASRVTVKSTIKLYAVVNFMARAFLAAKAFPAFAGVTAFSAQTRLQAAIRAKETLRTVLSTSARSAVTAGLNPKYFALFAARTASVVKVVAPLSVNTALSTFGSRTAILIKSQANMRADIRFQSVVRIVTQMRGFLARILIGSKLQAVARHRIRTVLGVAPPMAQAFDLTPIDASVEAEIITFDYGLLLSPGVALSAITSVSCFVHYGVDATPGNRLIGLATVAYSPTTKMPNGAVQQIVGNMVAGTTYSIQCVAQTTDGQSLSIWTRLACIPVV